MNQGGLERYGVYQKALELFDLVVADMDALRSDPRCYRLIGQQVASADSVCSNVEEGYGRVGRPEYIRFLDFARGSARETMGRYGRLKHWLGQEVIEHRCQMLDEIIGGLTRSINSMRRQQASDTQQRTRAPSPARDTRHSTPDTGSLSDTRHSTPDTFS